MAHQPLPVTWCGYVPTTQDAMLLVEACFLGHLSSAHRRPLGSERPDLIKSGHVFVYEVSPSGSTRWTDGVSWSPSRILGDFVLYREVDSPSQTGEKKRTMKQSGRPERGVTKLGSSPKSCHPMNLSSDLSRAQDPRQVSSLQARHPCDVDRRLVGSLVNNYHFKRLGLVKKTISVRFQNKNYRMISYYTIEDVMSNRLQTPCLTPELRIHPPHAAPAVFFNMQIPIKIIHEQATLWVTDFPKTTMMPTDHHVFDTGCAPNQSILVPNNPGPFVGSRTHDLLDLRQPDSNRLLGNYEDSQCFDHAAIPRDHGRLFRPSPLPQAWYHPSSLLFDLGAADFPEIDDISAVHFFE